MNIIFIRMSKIIDNTDYSRSVSQKKIKMKTKQHKTDDKDIREAEKESDDKLTELYVKFFFQKICEIY